MVKILLASNNACKVVEIKALLKGYEIYAFGEILKPFEIEENGTSFKENALIKSRAVFCALSQKQKSEFITLSDDSGISVAALNGAPSIHSARFSAQKTDKANRAKLISELKARNLEQSAAFYTACIALCTGVSSLWSAAQTALAMIAFLSQMALIKRLVSLMRA